MIFVTGAGGTVGGELVKKLLALGVKFRAGYHSSAKAEEAKQRGVDSVAIDFANPEALQLLLRGVDKLFLISGNIPHQDELELNVVREAKKAGVRHIVKNSAAGGEKVSYGAISDAEFKRAMVSSRVPEEAADAIMELFHYYLSGQASRISPAVRQITGKEPISFSQYARDYAASFLQEAKAAE